jgi:uncharacterized membrane protein required for colicin V production
MKQLDNLPFNWFDIFLLAWLAMGIFRGRKRGMSEELLTFLQWVVIVFFCSVAYQPAGDWLAQTSRVFGHLASYIIGYLVAAGVVSIGFVLFKRAFHGKLIGSDAFGKAEYYLGMPAGMLRFFCMLLTGLALLNARYYSPQEIQTELKYQKDVYGSDFFPGLQEIQYNVFEKSFTGPFIKKYLNFLLIRPTGLEGVQPLKQKEWQMK